MRYDRTIQSDRGLLYQHAPTDCEPAPKDRCRTDRSASSVRPAHCEDRSRSVLAECVFLLKFMLLPSMEAMGTMSVPRQQLPTIQQPRRRQSG